MTDLSARERLTARLAATSTDLLIATAIDLYARPGVRPEEERLLAGMTCDTLTARHPAADAFLERLFEDESPEGVEFIDAHTYGELVALAVTETAA